MWFKRDLRSFDHEPLARARAAAGGAVLLYIVEPAWLASACFDPTHLHFVRQSLAELRAKGLPVVVRHGDAEAVLRDLHAKWPFDTLLSHQETGPDWSYARDLAVRRWCGARGIDWQECFQDGVVRRLADRDGWAQRWLARMARPLLGHAGAFEPVPACPVQPLPTLAALGLALPPVALQPAGEDAGWAVLRSFVEGRGRAYRSGMSSPLRAETECSRLSPHLAYGTVSMKAVHRFTQRAVDGAGDDRELAASLRAFGGRLRWHCHFMQKLESEPAIEWSNFVRAADGLRSGDVTPMDDLSRERLAAWADGRTGYPMVDACMRFLAHHRWLNFRMRAMVTSFASYHLWLHWRPSGEVLARRFLDYEAGIHWSQMQMQSGTTGINTLRIYSPAKQALDQDPDGDFVRRWVPEAGSDAYPAPIVDHAEAVAAAKARLYASRRGDEARAEQARVTVRHGSRKPPRTRRPGARAPG